jgi:hypothetical protein
MAREFILFGPYIIMFTLCGETQKAVHICGIIPNEVKVYSDFNYKSTLSYNIIFETVVQFEHTR